MQSQDLTLSLTNFFTDRGGNPADFKTMHIAVYNGGIETIKTALRNANATNATAFNDLITPPLGGTFPVDTPLYKAVKTHSVGNGIGKNPTPAQIENRFNQVRKFPGTVLGIAGTNSP